MSSFAPRCLSIDLEVGLRDSRIHSIAAARGDNPDATLHFKQGKLLAALEKLDTLAEGASFLLGHNLIAFDLPHLAAAKPDLRWPKHLPTIAALAADDGLTLGQEKSGAWVLSNARGAIVGKLSRAFAPPEGMHCIQARVAAIHVRRRKDVGEEHQARLSDQCEAWEMIVPEVVFAPATRK